MAAHSPSEVTREVSWGTEVVEEAIGGVNFKVYRDRPSNVAGLLVYAERWGDRPHLVQGEIELSFHDLRRAVSIKSQVLLAQGVSPGDRILLLGFNSPEWIINFWSCVAIGAVPVLANAWWSEEDLAHATALVTPRLTLADARGTRLLPDGVRTAPWECPVPPPSGDQIERPGFEPSEDDPAAIVFTSGTAGRPKAVVLTHRALLAGLHMLLHITRRLPHQVDESAGSAGLHTGPMFHIGGVQTLIRAIVVGDTLVMPRGRFDPGEAIELIARWRVVRWSAVPTMLSRVLEHPNIADHDVTSLASITAGGAPITAEFISTLRSGFPNANPRVATGYGLTENGGQATAASGRDTGTRPGSCGRALPLVELKIGGSDDTGTGEVQIKSPTQMTGYFGISETPIDAEGWLSTGDLGHVDDEGYLWITGRSKDMIIRGGENIAPAAVEEALGRINGVVESSVFGVPHPDLGEEVVAAVTVAVGTSQTELESRVRELLPSFAVPTRWRFQDDPLPTNHSGKIDKNQLRSEELASLEGEADRRG